MDVKSFIFEATDKALKIDEALKGVEKAKENVELARAAVETAKAGVDTAKQAVSAAKEELDAYAERAEDFGLTKSKFKDAVERMKSLLSDIGAVDIASGDGGEPTEAKPKTPRKRKTLEASDAAVAQQVPTDPTNTESTGSSMADQTVEAVSADSDVIVIGEIADEASRESARKAAETGYLASESVEHPEEARSEVAATSDDENDDVAGDSESAELEAPQHLPASTSETGEGDELDNSFAEQELLDLVDEVGGTDASVEAALKAAVKVVSWHTTSVQRKVLRTVPSPLSIAGVLVVEDCAYAPPAVQEAYARAVEIGSQKLSAAISWFNNAVDVLSEGGTPKDFAFNAPRSSAPTATETSPVPDDAAVTDEAAEEILGDHDASGYSVSDIETIEDMELFGEPTATPADIGAPDATTAVEEDEATQVAPPAAPAMINKPSWLKTPGS